MKYLKSQIKATKAFTLAEVLITLTIIGVIAALAIPALIQSTQNAELRVAARKALSEANQAYLRATIDNGGAFPAYNGGNSPNAGIKFDALASKLNVVKYCTHNSNAFGNCWASSGVGPQGLTVSGCGNWSNVLADQGANNSFATSDGMYWMLYTYTPPNGSDEIVVDVNGNKGPNDWGKDVYYFKLNDTNITPYNGTCNLRHNDNSTVVASEFVDLFKQ